jgi:hypothetical protein
MSFFFPVHHRTYICGEIAVTGIFAQKPAQIMVFFAEQAGAQFSVGGQPDTRAMPSKWLSYRSNQADFPGAVSETIFTGGFTGLMRNRTNGQRALIRA